MKILFLVLFFQLVILKTKVHNVYYQYEIDSIIREFRENILNEEKCERLMYKTSEIKDEIENVLLSKEVSESDKPKLNELKRICESLMPYIGAVGGCSNTFPTLQEFQTANSLVKGTVSNIVGVKKFCVNFISVSIDDYVVFLGENNTNHNYKVSYKWKAVNTMKSGHGSMGLFSKNLRHIYDNRENIQVRKIQLSSVTCSVVAWK